MQNGHFWQLQKWARRYGASCVALALIAAFLLTSSTAFSVLAHESVSAVSAASASTEIHNNPMAGAMEHHSHAAAPASADPLCLADIVNALFGTTETNSGTTSSNPLDRIMHHVIAYSLFLSAVVCVGIFIGLRRRLSYYSKRIAGAFKDRALLWLSYHSQHAPPHAGYAARQHMRRRLEQHLSFHESLRMYIRAWAQTLFQAAY